MALTRGFNKTVQTRVEADPAFGEAMPREGVESLIGGDVDCGKAALRDYFKATGGSEKPGSVTDSSPKSRIRMFGTTGNPQARNSATCNAIPA